MLEQSNNPKYNKVFVISDERCCGTQLGNIFEIVGYSRIDDPQTIKTNRNKNIFNKSNVLKNFNYFMKNYNYIKICTISFSFKMYARLIRKANRKGYKIIFLWRKNYLERALSRAIAHKTKTWSIEDKTKKWHNNFVVKEKMIERDIHKNMKSVQNIIKYLNELNINYYNLEYSELYGNDLDINQRFDKIKSLFEYIDSNILKELSSNKKKDILDRLSPIQKVNTISTYKRITNIEKILKKFSNKKYGIINI